MTRPFGSAMFTRPVIDDSDAPTLSANLKRSSSTEDLLPSCTFKLNPGTCPILEHSAHRECLSTARQGQSTQGPSRLPDDFRGSRTKNKWTTVKLARPPQSESGPSASAQPVATSTIKFQKEYLSLHPRRNIDAPSNPQLDFKTADHTKSTSCRRKGHTMSFVETVGASRNLSAESTAKTGSSVTQQFSQWSPSPLPSPSPSLLLSPSVCSSLSSKLSPSLSPCDMKDTFGAPRYTPRQPSDLECKLLRGCLPSSVKSADAGAPSDVKKEAIHQTRVESANEGDAGFKSEVRINQLRETLRLLGETYKKAAKATDSAIKEVEIVKQPSLYENHDDEPLAEDKDFSDRKSTTDPSRPYLPLFGDMPPWRSSDLGVLFRKIDLDGATIDEKSGAEHGSKRDGTVTEMIEKLVSGIEGIHAGSGHNEDHTGVKNGSLKCRHCDAIFSIRSPAAYCPGCGKSSGLEAHHDDSSDDTKSLLCATPQSTAEVENPTEGLASSQHAGMLDSDSTEMSYNEAMVVLGMERFISVNFATLKWFLNLVLNSANAHKAAAAFTSIVKHQDEYGWGLRLRWNDEYDMQLLQFNSPFDELDWDAMEFAENLGTTVLDCRERLETLKSMPGHLLPWNSAPKAMALEKDAHVWTEEDDRLLMYMKTQNRPYSEITEELCIDEVECKRRFKEIKPKDWRPNSNKDSKQKMEVKVSSDPDTSDNASAPRSANDKVEDYLPWPEVTPASNVNNNDNGWGTLPDSTPDDWCPFGDDRKNTALCTGCKNPVGSPRCDCLAGSGGCQPGWNDCQASSDVNADNSWKICNYCPGCGLERYTHAYTGCGHQEFHTAFKPCTVTYSATIESGGKELRIPIESRHVSGPQKSIATDGMPKVWKWIYDKGLGGKVGLQDAFDLARSMNEFSPRTQTRQSDNVSGWGL